MNPYPLRPVVTTKDYSAPQCRPGEGSRIHYLDCGHRVTTKQSHGYPARKRCRDCGLNRPPDPPQP
jgi:hypothetical protein